MIRLAAWVIVLSCIWMSIYLFITLVSFLLFGVPQ